MRPRGDRWLARIAAAIWLTAFISVAAFPFWLRGLQ